MQVWPAIDLRGGKCVRLRQGDYKRETVFGDPVKMAQRWASAGAAQLHLVDLDGARDGHGANWDAVAAIVEAIEIPCQLGGGIRDQSAIEQLLEVGVSRLVIGTRALKEPDWFRQMCRQYPDRLALGLDARDGMVATDGWLVTSDVPAVELANQFREEPVSAIIYTDIACDGMMSGPNLAAMKEMNDSVDKPVIASGGVTTVADVKNLSDTGLSACIIGRSLYEGQISLEDAHRAAS